MAARKGLIWISCNNHISSNDTQLKTQFLTRFFPFTSLLERLLLFHSFKCYFSSSSSLIPSTAEKRRWQKRKGCLMAARYTMYTKRFYFIVITNIWISNQSKLCVIVVTCCFSHPFYHIFVYGLWNIFSSGRTFLPHNNHKEWHRVNIFLRLNEGLKFEFIHKNAFVSFPPIKFVLS